MLRLGLYSGIREYIRFWTREEAGEILLCEYKFSYFFILTGYMKKETVYDYSSEVHYNSGNTSWVFNGEYPPPFELNDEEKFISSVNAALRSINVDEINSVVKEKSKIIGSRYDRAVF